MMKTLDNRDISIGVIGLGYVGLPLAVEFARKYPVMGFDIKKERIEELRQGRDGTREVTSEELALAGHLELASNPEALQDCNVYIVTVPTPIDDAKCPDLCPLEAASRTVGKVLKPGDTVIYESTVYPGCTEEDCVPILEQESGLECAFERSNDDAEDHQASANKFYVGYSPERVNPGDKQHRLPTIKKVISGSTPEAAEFIDKLYATIITAGTHRAASIKVAEAAKVIENTQRDVNIGLINELAMLFGRMGIDTASVLEAAGTKWNFLPFRPGLVGGHCIGVDPYYLTYKAQQIGFHPQMILAGRRTNDGMGQYVAGEMVKLMARKGVYAPGARVLILGLTFKENCPDLRNTRVVDVIAALRTYNLNVDIYDPWANPEEAREQYGLELTTDPEPKGYDAAILCVAHKEFTTTESASLGQWLKPQNVVYDLKGSLPPNLPDARL